MVSKYKADATVQIRKTGSLNCYLLILFLLSTTMLHSQKVSNSRTATTLSEVFQNIGSDSSEAVYLRSLLQEVQPSVYIQTGKMNEYGSRPVCLYTDVQSIKSLSQHKIPESIEMIIVRFNLQEPTSKIDMQSFSHLPKLKYVYLLSSEPFTENEIKDLLVNNDNINIKVFYEFVKDM